MSMGGVDFVRSLLLPTVCSYKRRPSIAVASAYSWILSQQECQMPEKYNAINYGKSAAYLAQIIEDWSQLTLSLPLLAPGSNHSWKKTLHSSTLFVAVPIPSVMSVGFAARQPKTAKKAKAIGSFAALYAALTAPAPVSTRAKHQISTRPEQAFSINYCAQRNCYTVALGRGVVGRSLCPCACFS